MQITDRSDLDRSLHDTQGNTITTIQTNNKNFHLRNNTTIHKNSNNNQKEMLKGTWHTHKTHIRKNRNLWRFLS